MESRMKLMLELDVSDGAGDVTGVRVRICAGDGGCASWGGVQVGLAR
jgi:hypothetical protein